ncbi:MAG TPA: hypothetical protein PK776_06645 [Flavobacterium sp.]|nr:hypothetical protein [Flavobacterium sp.]
MKSHLIKFYALVLLCGVSFAQPKDTIYGKIKSIREQLFFLDENIQNRKLFGTEGDYGHYGFMSEKFTKVRFNNWWYDTYWVHYLNYYKEYDKNNRPLKVAWYNKDQSILKSSENQYASDGKLINQKLNTYQESNVILKYNKKNNLISQRIVNQDKTYSTKKYKYNRNNQIIKYKEFNSRYPKEVHKKEYSYNIYGDTIEVKYFNEYGPNYGYKYEYDSKRRKIKTLNHSPFIWDVTPQISTQKRIKNGIDYLRWENKYDEKDRIIESKFYVENTGKVSLHQREEKIYELDLLKHVYVYNEKDSLSHYKKFEYDSLNRKTKESHFYQKFPEDNMVLEYQYKETLYPIKLTYTINNTSTVVDFEYVFDQKNNWIEQTKSVNGQKLYIWRRNLEYFN